MCHCPFACSAAQKRSASGSFARTRDISSSVAVWIARSNAPFSSGLGNLTVGKEGSGDAWTATGVSCPSKPIE